MKIALSFIQLKSKYCGIFLTHKDYTLGIHVKFLSCFMIASVNDKASCGLWKGNNSRCKVVFVLHLNFHAGTGSFVFFKVVVRMTSNQEVHNFK